MTQSRNHTGTAVVPPLLRRTTHPAGVGTVTAAGVALVVVAGLLLGRSDDAGALVALNRWHTGTIGAVASAAYNLIEPVPAIGVTVVATALLWWGRRDLRLAAAFAGVVALTWIPSDVVKFVVDRARPDQSIQPFPFSPAQPDPSFPSGHTVFAAAFVLALAWALWDTRWRAPVAAVGGVLVAVLAVSVLVDALHYPTDVLASLVWAAIVIPAARWLWVDVVLARVPLPYASAPDRGRP